MKTIPVFFTFDHYFVLGACVAFHTLLERASKSYDYHLYVVHTGLSRGDRQRLERVVGRFPNARLSFKDASSYDTNWDAMQNKSHFSKEIFYKMTAAEMFPEYDRILFSDVDVIFRDDIAPSYFLFPQERFYFAGTRPILENGNIPGYARDFTAEEIHTINMYEISAGYMLINLACMRLDGKQQELMAFFRRNCHRLRLPEQDCIALCCTQGLRFMDYKYVVCNSQFNVDFDALRFNTNNPRLADRKQALDIYKRMLKETVQLHYPGVDKPWNSPFVAKYGEWLKACVEAGQLWYYIGMQPAFLLQRLRRYSLKRFVGKLMAKTGLRKDL